jgi:hypothetical protein
MLVNRREVRISSHAIWVMGTVGALIAVVTLVLSFIFEPPPPAVEIAPDPSVAVPGPAFGDDDDRHIIEQRDERQSPL